MKINVKLFRQVRDAILEEPKRLLMSNWIRRTVPGLVQDFDGVRRTAPSCGIVGCIAGWSCFLSGYEESAGRNMGRKLLRLTDTQANGLFYVDHWSPHFQRLWKKTKSAQKRAEIVARVIDRFVAKHI